MKNNFNPPFSLFREYVKQLMDYGKKFIIVGPKNAITYKEIFPYIKNNELWMGWGFSGGNAYFKLGKSVTTEYSEGVFNADENVVKFRNCGWFTNVSHEKRNTLLDLYKRYSNEYPKYDNYDAINVNKVAEIPADYNGVMGVPITFLDSYCPEQFEIVGLIASAGYIPNLVNIPMTWDKKQACPYVNGKKVYSRILIRKRNEK